jgi:hypothetical protein
LACLFVALAMSTDPSSTATIAVAIMAVAPQHRQQRWRAIAAPRG